jgi:D-amino peptidase
MNVYIICDLEGTAGIVDFKRQCMFEGEHYIQARRLATLELNAAVEGALAAGAGRIVAWDGHGGFPGGLDVELVHPRCELVMAAGDGGPVGRDESFGAQFLVGLHGMAGARHGVLAHSFTGFVARMLVNGEEVGEIGMNFHGAGVKGIPAVLITGDQAAADEARALVPAIETAVVKRGLGSSHRLLVPTPAVSLAPEAAREVIRAAAERAMAKADEIEPFTYEGPYTVRTTFIAAKWAARALERSPQARQIDETTLELEMEELTPLL